jgi:hypothetical protein
MRELALRPAEASSRLSDDRGRADDESIGHEVEPGIEWQDHSRSLASGAQPALISACTPRRWDQVALGQS